MSDTAPPQFQPQHVAAPRVLTTRHAVISSVCVWCVVFSGLLFFHLRKDGIRTEMTGGATYQLIAENLTRHGRYSIDGIHPTGYRPPLYPLVLAGIHHLTNAHARLGGAAPAVTILAVHLALDLACLALLLMLTHRLTRSPRAMLAAGTLFALDTAFHHETLAQRETVLYTALLLGFAVLMARRTVSLSSLMSATVVAALAWLARPTGILLVPLILAMALFAGPDRAWRLRVMRAAVVCLLLSAVVMPWQAFLYRSFHAWVPAGATSGGLNLYQGNNPAAGVLIPYVDVDAYKPAIDDRLSAEGLPPFAELARDRRLRAEAIAYIQSDPVAFAHRAVANALALFSPVPTPLGSARLMIEDDGDVRLADLRYHASPWTFVSTAFGLTLLAGVAFALLSGRRPHPYSHNVMRVVWGYILLTTALHAVTFGETRFRLPLDPLLIAIAATAIPLRRPSGQAVGANPP